jgi:hypothetical protein
MTTGTSGREVLRKLAIKFTPPVFHGPQARKHGLAAILHAMFEVTLVGDFAEFGVFKGVSARFLSQFLYGERSLHLFDSFEGLPEAWVGVDGYDKGHFSTNGQVPRIRGKHVHIHKGWFSDTIPPFAEALTQPLSFIHMDADLYGSTMDVFNGLNEFISPGTIILFNEYVMKQSEDEHRALLDWSQQHRREFQYLWRSESVQVAIRVTK